MSEQKTYFGLEVHIEPLGPCVYQTDIQQLPFYEFWLESSIGSTQGVNAAGELCIYLHDWERFATQFIKTGTHRYHKPPRG